MQAPAECTFRNLITPIDRLLWNGVARIDTERIPASGFPADMVHRVVPEENGPFVRWWYVQGFFEGEGIERRNFVICFFSLCLPDSEDTDEEGGRIPGALYLCSVVDPVTDVHHREMRIDTPLYTWYLGQLDAFPDKLGVSRYVSDTIRREIAEHGLYPPITCPGTTMKIESTPFSLTWDDARISFVDDEIIATFRDTTHGETVSCAMVPQMPFTDLSSLAPPDAIGMQYITCPRLKLQGIAGGVPVSGEAWCDYQSGGTTWFLDEQAAGPAEDASPSCYRPLGWDWCGIQLEDGRSLMLMHRRNLRSKETVSTFCILFSRDGDATWHADVEARPVRTWESLRTHIHYPVEWEFSIPALDATLRFTPDIDEQEIEIIGMDGGLWEGTGSIAGRMGADEICGRGQLELCGYGFIANISDFVGRFEPKINERLEQLFPREIDEKWCTALFGKSQPVIDYTPFTETISRPVWDLLSRQGKHWRPIFGILIADAVGVRFTEETEKLFVMTELLHSAALIIDDIEDESLLRRGDEAIHRRYGTDIAINAASTLYFFPQNIVSSCSDLTSDQKQRVLRLMTDTSLRAHLGQGQDIFWSKNLSPASLRTWRENRLDEQVLQMYAYKTASATEGVAELACILTEVPPETRAACLHFGRTMGISFQIIDDVLNFSGDATWGKSPGEDLRNGKPTYVILRALDMLDREKSDRLCAILCTPELRRDATILREGIELVRTSGALEDCSQRAVEKIESEWEAFSRHIPPSPGKLMLRVICANLVNMAYEV
jgi:geranylgeranyl diphosphate synthase type I